MKRALILGLAAVVAAPGAARAFWFDAGASGLVGSHNYSGSNFYAGLGDDAWSLKPAFSEYHADYTDGTYERASLRLGYDTPLWGVGVSGGETPSNDGYSSAFGGVDATVSLVPSDSESTTRINQVYQGGGAPHGWGVTRIDVGGGVFYTRHSEDLAPATTLDIGQTDLKGSVGVEVLDNIVSVQGTRSLYDHTMNASLGAFAAPVQVEDGLLAIVQGFPETNVNARVTMGFLPMIKPFVQYTHTVYELGAPTTDTYTVGGFVEFGLVEITAAYQDIVPTSGTSNNFVTAGAGLRF